MFFEDYQTFKIHPIGQVNCVCYWAFALLVSVWQPQWTDRLSKCELAIWNNGLSTRRVRDCVTRCPVAPGSHYLLSIKGGIGIIARSRTRSTSSVLIQHAISSQIHTLQNKCLSFRLSHVNAVAYGLSERKQVGENWMFFSIICIPSVLKGQNS